MYVYAHMCVYAYVYMHMYEDMYTMKNKLTYFRRCGIIKCNHVI